MLQTGGILALGAGVYLGESAFYASLMAVLAFAAVFSCRIAPGQKILSLFALVLLFSAGYLSINRSVPSPVPLGEEKRYFGTVARDPRPVAGGFGVEVELRGVGSPEPSGEWTPVEGKILLGIQGEVEKIPSPGEAVFFRAALKPPGGFRNPGAEWRPFYFKRNNILARGSAEYPGEVFFALPEEEGFLGGTRRTLGEAMEKTLPGEEGAVLRALVLGDWSRVPQGVLSDFRKCGTTHLLAVSGFHLGVVALGAMALLGFLWSRTRRLVLLFPARLAAKMMVFPLLAAYTLLTGSQVSTLRALGMTFIVLSGGLLCRRVTPFSTLASAVLFIGLWDPGMLFDAGLHLSVAALAGLFWLAPALKEVFADKKEEDAGELLLPKSRARKVLGFVSAKAADIVIVSGSATLATMPLGAWYFGGASWMGLLANPAGVPIVGAVALPFGILGGFLFPLWEGGAMLAWNVAGGSIALLLELQSALAPLSTDITGPFTSFWPVAGAYLLVFSLVLFREAEGGAKKRALAGAAGALFLAVPPAASLADGILGKEGHVWMLEAGQGQAVILKLPVEGPSPPLWMVIDAGGFPGSTFDAGENIVLPALRELGCRRIDVAVSTHPHPDHVLGLPAVIKSGKPLELWLPASFYGDSRYLPALAAAGEAGTKVLWIGPEVYRYARGSAIVEVYPGEGPEENDRSLAVAAQAGGGAVLVPGDVESEGQDSLLEKGLSGSFDFIAAPHHGSGNAVNERFLDAVAGDFYFAAAARDGELPSERFYEALRKCGKTCLSTGNGGALHGVFGGGPPVIIEGSR